jgi:acetate kinase
MNILALNPGSNSLKFELIASQPDSWGRKIFSGSIDSVGPQARLRVNGSVTLDEVFPVEDQQQAAERLLKFHVFEATSLDRIACRVVHGGPVFREPVLVTEEILTQIEALNELAPLHNANSVAILRTCLSAQDRVPVVAVFDSAFHHTLPEVAYRYPLEVGLSNRHQIRRYGFHGLSHEFLVRRYAEIRGVSPHDVNIVTLHLEGGASAAAIQAGKSIDTSMGFTPLEGLMMGTRSGDIDPAIVGYLAEKEGVSVAEVEQWLNRKSGLLGISGISQDTRILDRDPDPRAKLALEMFAYRARKYVGAYLAVLNGADAIVFGGGIGENTPSVRSAICRGLSWMGLNLDAAVNATLIDTEGSITTRDSRLQAYVIPTQEGLMLARLAAF